MKLTSIRRRANLISTRIRADALRSIDQAEVVRRECRHQIDTTSTLVFTLRLGKNARMNTKPTALLATKTLTRNKVLVLFSLVLWCLMLLIGAACRSTAPEAPRTELAVAPGGCAPV